MRPMTLDEFVETEIARLLRFQDAWKSANTANGSNNYPLIASTELSWQRFYLGYTSRAIERAYSLDVQNAA